MKSIRFIAAAVFATTLATAQFKPVASYKDIKYPALHNVNVPKPTRFQLANGMVVFLLEDHELPTTSMQAIIRTGARWVPADKAGLAQIAGTVLRTGGTPTHKGDDLDNLLDHNGAFLESSVSADAGTVQLQALKEDFDQLLPIFSDVLRNPIFPEDKIDLAKTRQKDSIARRNDDPQGITFRELRRILYGKDSAYSRQVEYDTVDAITRNDLIAFHRQFYQPENVILGVWGDFDATAMKSKIEKEFGAWPKGGNPKPPVPDIDAAARTRRGVYVINKDDVNQSLVGLGAVGGSLRDPDYAANNLLSAILGGGEFGSRLMDSVRSKAGLAYMSGSVWLPEYDHPGIYIAYVGTKSNTTMQAIELTRQELQRISEGEVTDRELAYAKDYILKGQAFDFDSTGKIIGRLMNYEYYGYPSDFLQQYTEAVKKATKADLQAAAKKYWTPDKLTLVVLGKTSDFDKPLSSLGKVENWDIAIPKPKSATVAVATPETLASGKQLLARVRQAHGGDKLASVKDYRSKGDMTMVSPQGEFSMKTEETIATSGKSLEKMATPMGEVLQGYDGKVAWMKTPQGIRELPPQAAAMARDSAFRETVPLLLANDVKVQSLGTVKLDGKDVEGLLVSDPSGKSQVKLFVDPKTNLLAGKEYSGMTMAGPGEVQEVYLEYRDVNGIKLPSHIILNSNGKKAGEVKIEAIEINTSTPDSTYAKP